MHIKRIGENFETDITSGDNFTDVTWNLNVESNGKLRIYLNKLPSASVFNSGYYESTSSIVDYDAWTYITMTTQDNGGSGNSRWMNFKFYKNGVLVDDDPTLTFTQNGTFRANPGDSWNQSGVTITRLFAGDDHKAGPLYVHDVTLTAAEIKRNYMQHKSRFQ